MLYFLILLWMFTGCSVQAPQAPTDAQVGHAALLAGNPELALSHFRRAAEATPDYVVDIPPLRQSIWTYLARAYYDTGKFSDARESASQALRRDDGESIARLYVGLIALREPPSVAGKADDNSFRLNDVLYVLKEKVSSRRGGYTGEGERNKF